MRWERIDPHTLSIDVDSEAETAALGAFFAEILGPGDVVGLVGPLGAGKTRFARAIAEALGVEPSAISSPTFVLIHEYEGSVPISHFDAYRLASPEEFDALGASEYWEGGEICLVEWADRVPDRLPPRSWRIDLEWSGADGRSLKIALPDPARVDRLESGLHRLTSPSSATP